jgi:hypothetical protein
MGLLRVGTGLSQLRQTTLILHVAKMKYLCQSYWLLRHFHSLGKPSCEQDYSRSNAALQNTPVVQPRACPLHNHRCSAKFGSQSWRNNLTRVLLFHALKPEAVTRAHMT